MIEKLNAWRTVPVEPTEAMMRAAELAGLGDPDEHHETVIARLWSAMLAASPVVPVGVSREEIARTLYEATPARVIHPLPIHSLSWDDIKTKDPARADRAYREADAILAALGTKGADTGWRDIATAPRDGTRLVLWDLSRAVFGSWRVDEGFSSKEPMWLDESYNDYSCGFASNPLEPTYWMPIPPAPTDTGRE